MAPFYADLYMLAWIAMFHGPRDLAWPAFLLLFGIVGLFLALQAWSNQLQDDEIRKNRRAKP
jgi:hypothetical protein